MSKLTDRSPMPWGKYENLPLEEVPAWYLLYIYEKMKPKAPNKRNLSEKMLMVYIEDNMQVLLKQKKENHGNSN